MSILTPMKAIRAKCLDCCCGNPFEVKMCPVRDCSLHPYRDGHNPNRKGVGMKGGNPDLRKQTATEIDSKDKPLNEDISD